MTAAKNDIMDDYKAGYAAALQDVATWTLVDHPGDCWRDVCLTIDRVARTLGRELTDIRPAPVPRKAPECQPHPWKVPVVGDPALVCERCGRELPFNDMTGNVAASIANSLKHRRGEAVYQAFHQAKAAAAGLRSGVSNVEAQGPIGLPKSTRPQYQPPERTIGPPIPQTAPRLPKSRRRSS